MCVFVYIPVEQFIIKCLFNILAKENEKINFSLYFILSSYIERYCRRKNTILRKFFSELKLCVKILQIFQIMKQLQIAIKVIQYCM